MELTLSYSNTICRRCEKNTYTNLEDSGYVCASCIKDINKELVPNNTNLIKNKIDDGIVHKNIKWLQGSFKHRGVTSNSAHILWVSPKYKDEEFEVANYFLLIKEIYQRIVIPGYKLSYKLENLESGKTYNLILEAMSMDGNLIKNPLKQKITTASLE